MQVPQGALPLCLVVTHVVRFHWGAGYPLSCVDRLLQIRCDRKSPCVQCRRADIECVHPGIKPREKRSRVLITPQYEKKIDLIDSRLEEVVGLLRNLLTHVSAPGNTHDDVPVPPPAHPSLVRRALPLNSENAAVVEGSSSLSAHSVFNFDRSSRYSEYSPGYIVSDRGGTTKCRPVRDSRPEEVQTTAHSRCYKFDSRCISLSVIFVSRSISRNLYLPMIVLALTPACSLRKNNALYTLVYAETISKPDWPNYRYIYQNRQMDWHLTEIQAYYAIEFSTASLCWSLASKASALCQTLGYHRTVTSHDRVVTNSKYTRFLFWTTYYLDKSLSLRLGRASTIQDWDVTAIPPSASSTD
ncbi:hypothetical protein D6D17_05495 [Aureobasidium pullulans]|nr:hypothetical protein D6D17_05495 [Aureobasidium pullulans]